MKGSCGELINVIFRLMCRRWEKVHKTSCSWWPRI